MNYLFPSQIFVLRNIFVSYYFYLTGIPHEPHLLFNFNLFIILRILNSLLLTDYNR